MSGWGPLDDEVREVYVTWLTSQTLTSLTSAARLANLALGRLARLAHGRFVMLANLAFDDFLY